eukprot:g38359.t1
MFSHASQADRSGHAPLFQKNTIHHKIVQVVMKRPFTFNLSFVEFDKLLVFPLSLCGSLPGLTTPTHVRLCVHARATGQQVFSIWGVRGNGVLNSSLSRPSEGVTKRLMNDNFRKEWREHTRSK